MRWGPVIGVVVAACGGLATGASAAWVPMGPTPVDQAADPTVLEHPDVAVAGGVPHVAYVRRTFTTSDLAVRRADPAGGGAVTVPSPPGTAGARLSRLAASGNQLHAAWVGERGQPVVATWDGTAWSPPADLGAIFDLGGEVRDLDVAVIGGRPWLAWSDDTTTVHVAERTDAGWQQRASPPSAGIVKRAPRLAEGPGGAAILADVESGESSDERVEVWHHVGGDVGWTPYGGWSQSVDEVADASGTVRALDLTMVGAQAVIAVGRSSGLRVLSSTGGPWAPEGGTVAAAGVEEVSVRRTGGGLTVAIAQLDRTSGTRARVLHQDPVLGTWSAVAEALNGFAAPSAASGVALADADGVPVVGFVEAHGSLTAVRLSSFVPTLTATRSTATPDSVSLFVTPDTDGLTLPVALQREGRAPEQPRAARDAEVGWTVGGLAPDTEVRWRPVLTHGPFVRGGSFLSARSAAPPAPPPPPSPASPPAPPPAETTTGASTPPPAPQEPDPTLGRTAAVDATRGRVVVTRPGGRPQVLGPEAGLLPIGTKIDVTKGRVELWFDTPDGKGQTRGFFYQGAFKISSQARKTGLVTLQLDRPTHCATTRRGARAAGRKRNKLWGKGKGRFRTRGRFGAATVRGTTWSTEDACDRTTIGVVEGVVDATDLVRDRTTRLRAGRSYTARRR